MAYEKPVLIQSFTAENAISQFRVVELTGADQVDMADGANDTVVGVCQNDPAAGETAEIMMFGISKVEVGDATSLVRGAAVATTGTTGLIQLAATGQRQIGIALETAGAAGDIISVLVCPSTVVP